MNQPAILVVNDKPDNFDVIVRIKQIKAMAEWQAIPIIVLAAINIMTALNSRDNLTHYLPTDSRT